MVSGSGGSLVGTPLFLENIKENFVKIGENWAGNPLDPPPLNKSFY